VNEEEEQEHVHRRKQAAGQGSHPDLDHRDLDAADELYAPNCVTHQQHHPAAPGTGTASKR